MKKTLLILLAGLFVFFGYTSDPLRKGNGTYTDAKGIVGIGGEAQSNIYLNLKGNHFRFANGSIYAPDLRIAQFGNRLSISPSGEITIDTTTITAGGGGDDLGSHVATQNLDLSTFKLVGGGGTGGLAISNVLGRATFDDRLTIGEDLFVGDGDLNGTTVNVGLSATSGVQQIKFRSNGVNVGFDTDNNFGFMRGNNKPFRFYSNTADVNTPNLYMTTNGRTGIRTINPQTEFHVVGKVRFETVAGTGTRVLQIESDGDLIAGEVAVSGDTIHVHHLHRFNDEAVFPGANTVQAGRQKLLIDSLQAGYTLYRLKIIFDTASDETIDLDFYKNGSSPGAVTIPIGATEYEYNLTGATYENLSVNDKFYPELTRSVTASSPQGWQVEYYLKEE